MVSAFVNVRSHKRHACSVQRNAVCIVAKGDRRSFSHGIEPRAGFPRSREEQPATAGQNSGDLGDQLALRFRAEQKEEPPCNRAIKSSAEEIRVFYSGALNRRGWEVRPEFRSHAG